MDPVTETPHECQCRGHPVPQQSPLNSKVHQSSVVSGTSHWAPGPDDTYLRPVHESVRTQVIHLRRGRLPYLAQPLPVHPLT